MNVVLVLVVVVRLNRLVERNAQRDRYPCRRENATRQAGRSQARGFHPRTAPHHTAAVSVEGQRRFTVYSSLGRSSREDTQFCVSRRIPWGGPAPARFRGSCWGSVVVTSRTNYVCRMRRSLFGPCGSRALGKQTERILRTGCQLCRRCRCLKREREECNGATQDG